MLFFLMEIGATADRLSLLPFSTLTLLSALTLRAETAVVIGATTEPIRPPALAPPPANAGEALSTARETATTYFIVSSVIDQVFNRLARSLRFFSDILAI